MCASRFISRRRHTRQNNSKFSELAGPGIYLYRPRMLLDDDVVTDRQAKSGTLAGGFGREERVEHLVFDLGRDARSIVPYTDFHSIAEILGGSSEGRLKTVAPDLPLALSSGVKAV